MQDQDKTKQQLICELEDLRRRVITLEAAERRYRTIIDTVPLAIGEINRDGIIVFANAATEKLFGYKPEELVGKRAGDGIEPEIAREAFRAWFCHTMLEQPTPSPVFACQANKNGERIDVRGDWNYLRNEKGEVIGQVTVIADITESKRAKEALQRAHDELEQRVQERTAELTKANEELSIFREFADASGQGFSMADLDGHLIYLNPTLCRMLGEERQEVWIGQHLSICYSVESNRRGKQEIEPALMRDGYWQGELPVLSRQGKSIPTWHNSFVIRDERGSPLRLAVVITDITARKLAEAALERERRTLKHMLEASDHERRLISYDIHDGLAQQLAGAIMHFQIYAHARDSKSKDAAKAFDAGMAMLQQSHVEARRLISGVRPPILDEFGVLAAIAHLVYDPAFEQRPKIEFRSKVTFNRLVPILENAVYRIVQEGLTNARNHSESKKIVVKLIQRSDRLRIKIRDWGVGFDPQAVEENRFGLQGIRERARLLKGKCSIKSKPGKGTFIVVELPVTERQSEQ